MKPVILLFGPSGVGKSYALELLANNCFLSVHIDTDNKKRTFGANGFPPEWDGNANYNKVNFPQLIAELRDRLESTDAGAAISFPTTYVFEAKQLLEAKQLGATPIILWCKKEDCIQAATKRINKKGLSFDSPRYESKNVPTFQTYSHSEYDAFRLEAFQDDGSRYDDEMWLKQIIKHTGIK